ncbi:MAG: glycosyltransferase [Spirosomataceae bacterium]
MQEKAIIVGAGTYGQVYAEYLKDEYQIIGFIDDDRRLLGAEINNIKVLGNFEYLLNQLPAIVTDINGCNEIIEEGKNGLIIPPKNEDALRAAMEKIVIDQTLYSQLKEHARPMITSRYEQQVVWNAILEEYNRLLIEKGFK